MKTIVLCSSAHFYEHVIALRDSLEKLGFRAVVPVTAEIMAEKGNYDVSAYKTWYDDEQMLERKQELMRLHFDKIMKGDAVLVVNDEKRGVKGYIGANVLMEMGLAFALHKPIFVLNPIQKENSYWEEVAGMGCTMLGGKIDKIVL